MHQNDTWQGEERRGIDGMTIRMMAEVRAAMEKHEKMEAKQFDELEKRIDLLTKRMESLCQSVTTYMEKTPNTIIDRIEELMDDAFPADPEMPDATPQEKRKLHRKYHAKLITHALEAQARNTTIGEKLITFVLEKGITIIAVSVAMYFGMIKAAPV